MVSATIMQSTPPDNCKSIASPFPHTYFEQCIFLHILYLCIYWEWGLHLRDMHLRWYNSFPQSLIPVCSFWKVVRDHTQLLRELCPAVRTYWCCTSSCLSWCCFSFSWQHLFKTGNTNCMRKTSTLSVCYKQSHGKDTPAHAMLLTVHI